VIHRACETPIYRVDRDLKNGDPIEAHEWHPVDESWPNPLNGMLMRCPNCGKQIHPDDEHLRRVTIDD